MAINEEHRQAEIAGELEELARTFAHSTRAIPNPQNSYDMLGDLATMVDHLEQVCDQLAKWHETVEDGVHYDGREPGREGTHPTISVAYYLREAAHEHLRLAAGAIRSAQQRNSELRWYPEPQ